MRIISFVFTILFFVNISYSEVSKTVSLSSPGTLSSKISSNELGTITNLTLIGRIDARDFKYISNELRVVETVDLGQCKIEGYYGIDGTMSISRVYYPENELPQQAFAPGYTNTGYNYFYGKKTLKSVVLPIGITAIGAYAFYECTGLTSIKLPPSLKRIGNYAFQRCTNLNSIQNLAIDMPNTGTGTFDGVNAAACTITVPTTLITQYQSDLSWKTFNYVAGGYAVNFTNSNEFAGTNTGHAYRFYSLNEHLQLKISPKNKALKLIWHENGAAFYTDSIYDFNIAGNRNITVFYKRAETIRITKPGTLKNIIIEPQTITHLTLVGNIDARDVRFIRENFKAVESVDFTNSIITQYYGGDGPYISGNTYVDNVFPIWAFYTYDVNQTARLLKDVKLPITCHTIEYNAFFYCRAFESITIPQRVLAIKDNVFNGCNSLKSICNLALKPAPINNSVFFDVLVSDCDLFVPIGSETDYKTAPFWNGFNIKTGGYSIAVSSNNTNNGIVEGYENRFYNSGETISLEAKATDGVQFLNWTENGIVISTNPVLSFNVDANRQLIANFGLTETVSVGKQGTLYQLVKNPKNVSHLTITGDLDARDFVFVRDSLPNIELLDIKNVQIKAYTVPNTSTSYKGDQLPNYAFSQSGYPTPGMRFLKTVILPDGLTVIGERSFYNCSELENVVMPLNLKNILSSAFGNCTGLKILNLPPKLSTIDYNALGGCSNLQTVNNFGLRPININVSSFVDDQTALFNLKVPVGSLEAYKANTAWSKYNTSEGGYVVTASPNTLTTGVVTGNLQKFYALNEQVSLTCSALNGTNFESWLDNGNSVSTTNDYSFQVSGHHNLIAKFTKKVSIADNVAGSLKDRLTDRISVSNLTIQGTIDARDFQFMRDSLPALEELNVAKCQVVAYTGLATQNEAYNYSANTLPANSFYNSKTSVGKATLRSIILPDSLKTIDSQSFRDCINLKTIIFPTNLQTIYGAFAGCTSLETIEIPNSVTSMSGSFSGCTGLHTVKLPSGLTNIGSEFFKNCIRLTTIEIPSGVKDIGYSAFQGCTSLKKIKLPDALTTIMHTAFSNCTSIDSLKIPSKLTRIDTYAFEGCTGLKDINFGHAIPLIETYAFRACSGLTKLIFPKGLKSIGWSAFENCTSLTTLVLPDELTTLGINAFSGCSSLTEVKIPGKLTELSGTFVNCTSLKKVVFQTGFKRILNSAFAGCASLTSVSIPTGVTYISNTAFHNCTSLTDVKLPAGITTIGGSAFSGCNSLKSIQLPSGLTKLEGSTFSNCTSLTSVTLPAEIGSLFTSEFSNCTKLTAIYNFNLTPLPANAMTYAFNEMDQSKCSLIVHSSAVNAYKVADVWRKFIVVDGGFSVLASSSNSVIGEVEGANRFYQPNETATLTAKPLYGATFVNWTENGNIVSTNLVFTFSVNSNRKLVANFTRELHVTLPQPGTLSDSIFDPNSVTKLTITGNIDARDFKFMRDNLPSTATFDLSEVHVIAYSGMEGTVNENTIYQANTVPIYAFQNNKLLKTIVLNNELETIDANAFYSCSSLISINLPANLKTIGNRAFVECNSLTTFVFPPKLETIGSSAFVACNGLTTIELPSGLLKLGTESFRLCVGLTTVKLPHSLQTIEMNTFSNCTNLTSVLLPENLARIEYGAFSGCSGITTLIFPANLTFIGTSAFSLCSSLKEITLSSNLNVIADYAFSDCTKLSKIINLNATPVSINAEVFLNLNQSNCSLIVPNGAGTLYKNKSVWKKFKITEGGFSIAAVSNIAALGTVSGVSNKMYALNEVVTLTAKRYNNSTFVNWTENETPISTDSVYSFTVSKSRKLTANFIKEVDINLPEPGTLQSKIENAQGISALTIEGNIDARDFRYIRENFTSLTTLNLKNAHIVSYTGIDGTLFSELLYPENELPDYAFYSVFISPQIPLTTVRLPDDLDSIGNHAFYSNTTLKNISLPNQLKQIGFGAFYGCTAIDTITLPAGLQSIKPECFKNCKALKQLVNMNETPIDITSDVFSAITLNTCNLIVPDNSIEQYKTKDVWEKFQNIVSLTSYLKLVQGNDEVIIYPIPVKNMLYILKSSSTDISNIRIFDLNGRLVLNLPENETNIDLSFLSANTYMLEMKIGAQRIVKKIIKE